MSRWRKKLLKSRAEKMLEASFKTGLREGFLKKNDPKKLYSIHEPQYDGHMLKSTLDK